MSKTVPVLRPTERHIDVSTFEESVDGLHSQLVRGRGAEDRLRGEYCTLIEQAVFSVSPVAQERMTNLLLALMLQTRDMYDGKGERRLLYVLLECWDDPSMHCWSNTVASKFRHIMERYFAYNTAERRYGSWRDVKYIFRYYNDRRRWASDKRIVTWRQSPILTIIADIVKKQIQEDYIANRSSLLAKWLPREKSAFAWQVPIFAYAMYGYKRLWPTLSKTTKAHHLARYRRMLSRLSQATTGAVQTLQCRNEWRYIDFARDVTSSTMARQHYAFLLQGSGSRYQMSPNKLRDRIQCKKNYLSYLEESRADTKDPSTPSIGDVVRAAWLVPEGETRDSDMLQLAYDTKVAQVEVSGSLRNMCAMCDTSSSMRIGNCHLFEAVGIAMLIAETSAVGPAILTFSAQPRWVYLKPTDSFIQKVASIRAIAHYAGARTDISKACGLLAARAKKVGLSTQAAAKLQLMVVSDMEMQEADSPFAGTDRGKSPAHAPTVAYWNMKSKHRFSAAVNENGVVLVSGHVSSVLKVLCTDGLQGLRPAQGVLSSERYTFFHNS